MSCKTGAAERRIVLATLSVVYAHIRMPQVGRLPRRAVHVVVRAGEAAREQHRAVAPPGGVGHVDVLREPPVVAHVRVLALEAAHLVLGGLQAEAIVVCCTRGSDRWS